MAAILLIVSAFALAATLAVVFMWDNQEQD